MTHLNCDDEEELLIMPGFDEAILGVVHGMGIEERVLYDEEVVIEILVEEHGLTEEEAAEHFDFNIIGSYVGPRTPLFLRPMYELEGYDGWQESGGRGETSQDPTETESHEESGPSGDQEERTAG